MTDIRKYVNVINEALQKEDKSYPDKYFNGISNKEKTQRKKDFEQNAKKDDGDLSAYEPMTGNDKETTTKSKCTNKYKEQFNDSKTALKNESVGNTLGDLISISTGKEDADLYVIRRGSLESVGKPTKEYNKEAYGITIKERDLLDPQYLYYMLMYVHSSGYFKSKAKGSTNLDNITKDDILNIPVK